MKNLVTALLLAGTVLAPLLLGAYTSDGYVRSFTVGDIKTTELGGNSYKDPIVLDANGGQGGPLLQYWVNDENFYSQNGYWEQYELPSCPFTREGYKFSGWKVYDACYVGDEGYTFVDSNGGSKYIGGSVGLYDAWDSIDICGWTALVAQWREAPKFGADGYARSFCADDLECEYNEQGDSYDLPILLVANGGDGGPLLALWRSDRRYVMPACPFTRDGYEFVGWKAFDFCHETEEKHDTITSCVLPSGETYKWTNRWGDDQGWSGYGGSYLPGEYYFDECPPNVLVAQWREKQASITFCGKWYEAAADDEGTTLVGWKQFFMGANVAIPVTVTDGDGNNRELTSDDITIKPGTFVDYGEPYVMTEEDMWDTYGSLIFDARNAGSRIALEKDGGVWVYNNWDWEDIAGVTYELEKGIWPFFDNKNSNYVDVNEWLDAHSDRQWIIIPTGTRPQKGTHTFTVSVKIGGKTASFPVSFTMNPDQRAKAATVRFNANGGTVSEYGRVVNLNKAIGELPAPDEREGYTFKGWYTAKTKGTKISASMKVTKAMTVYAQWSPKKYWVYYQDKINGTVNTGSGTKMSGMGKHAVGSKVTIKVEPINKNYVFSNWDWGMPDEIVPKKWGASPAGSEYTTFTFTMPPEDVMIVGYGMKKSADRAPRFTIDCGSTWYVEDQEEVLISIDSGSFPKLNTNKSIPAGMKLVRVQELRDYDCQCQYILKVSNRTKLPKGTVKTVKLTATNRSGKKTTRSFRVVMPNKTQAVDKGVLELNTSTEEPYELRAGMKFSWNDLGITVASGWKIVSVTGIPGLKWDAAKQKMTGVPSKAGTYAATFKVAKGKTQYTATATFTVEALPKAVVGAFYGVTKEYGMFGESEYDAETGEFNDVWSYGITKRSRKVTVVIASSGKVSATVGSLKFAATGLEYDEGKYVAWIVNTRKVGEKAYMDRLLIAVDPNAAWDEDALTGQICTVATGCKNCGGMCENYDNEIFARKNAATADAEAKAIAARYAKLGKQSLIVFKASSDRGYAYDLACPICVPNGDKAKKTVFLKIANNGMVTLSGTIAGTKVSGSSYLTYEYVGEDRLMAFARFFIGKLVIEIQGDTEDFYSNGSLEGRAWRK